MLEKINVAEVKHIAEMAEPALEARGRMLDKIRGEDCTQGAVLSIVRRPLCRLRVLAVSKRRMRYSVRNNGTAFGGLANHSCERRARHEPILRSKGLAESFHTWRNSGIERCPVATRRCSP